MYLGLNTLGLNSPNNGFSPSNLFAGGQQGVWFDASDLSTMFQDAAGTIPAALEQPVGLILDKSRGATRNPELVSSPSGNNGWTPSGTGGTKIVSGATGSLFEQVNPIANHTYEMIIVVTAISGTLTPQVGNTPSTTITTTGTHRRIITPTTGNFWYVDAPAATTATVASVSVREIPGNHASQTTTTSSPTLSARYNLFTESEFRNGVTDATQRSGLVSATTLAGYAGAIAFGRDGVTDSWAYKTNVTTVVGQQYTLAVVVAMDDGLPPVFGSALNTSVLNDFNITIANDAVGSSPLTYTITSLGGGQYRVSRTFTAAFTSANNGVVKFASHSTRTFKVTAYDIRLSTDVSAAIPSYQRVNTATDYDIIRFPTYLRFDGVDDSLATWNIDFTGTDKMTVFAGASKLVDTGVAGYIAEFSTAYNLNNGSFLLSAPEGGITGSYGFAVRGTANAFRLPTGYAAPTSNVLSASLNLAGANADTSVTARINGIAVATVAGGAAAGGGTFGNYALYIGSRGGTTARLNGRISQFIVRGAATSATDTSNCERYIAAKTGIVL